MEGVGRIEVNRLFERDSRFEQLMDYAAELFGIAAVRTRARYRDVVERAAGLQAAPYPGAHYLAQRFRVDADDPVPTSELLGAMHVFPLRCDRRERSTFTLLPGSHLSDHGAPPPWDGPGNQPRHIDGQLAMTGRAGVCLINNTEIWHTKLPESLR